MIPMDGVHQAFKRLCLFHLAPRWQSLTVTHAASSKHFSIMYLPAAAREVASL